MPPWDISCPIILAENLTDLVKKMSIGEVLNAGHLVQRCPEINLALMGDHFSWMKHS